MSHPHPDKEEEYSFDDVFDYAGQPDIEYVEVDDNNELVSHNASEPETTSDYEAPAVDDYAPDPTPEPISPPAEIPDYHPPPEDFWPDEQPMPEVNDTWVPDNGDREEVPATPIDSLPDDGPEYADMPGHAGGQAGSEHASSEPVDIPPVVEEPNLAGGLPLANAEVNAHLQTQLDREAEACAGDGHGGSAPF